MLTPFQTSLKLECRPKASGGAGEKGALGQPWEMALRRGPVQGERGVARHPSPRSSPCTGGADVLMEVCCADGHRMATQHKDCSLPYTSNSKECRYVCQWPPRHRDGVPWGETRGGRGSVCQAPREAGCRAIGPGCGRSGGRAAPASLLRAPTDPVLSSDCPLRRESWQCSSLCSAGHSGRVSFLVTKGGGEST